MTERSIRLLSTPDLGHLAVELRALLDAAWAGKEDEFSDTDWGSALGGTHVFLEVGGAIVSHASVVGRILESGEHPMRTGYVEAVATRPEQQGNGYATEVMGAVARILDERYELGALDTSLTSFYGRLGWEVWRGRTTVRTDRGMIGTPEEDGLVMVRRTPTTPSDLDLDAPISCDWRPGDVW